VGGGKRVYRLEQNGLVLVGALPAMRRGTVQRSVGTHWPQKTPSSRGACSVKNGADTSNSVIKAFLG
jgi:hypothetical protein